MQRNMALIRNILLQIEPLSYPNQYITFHFDEHDTFEVDYHLTMLIEAGLIQAESNDIICFDEWNNVRLTWAGHELLDLARNEEIWQTQVEQLADKTGGVNVELLKQGLLKALAS